MVFAKAHDHCKRLIGVCCLMGISLLGSAQQASDQIQRRAAQLTKEIEQLQQQILQTSKNKSQSLRQAELLSKKIQLRQQLIAQYEREISHIDQQIQKKNIVIESLAKELNKLRHNYARMIVYSYKHQRSHTWLTFLFAAPDFNSALQRMKYLRRFQAYRRQQIHLIAQAYQELNEQVVQLQNHKQMRQQLLTAEQKERDKLASEKAEKDRLVKSLKHQEKELRSRLEKKKKDKEALTRQITALIQKESKAASKKNNAAKKDEGQALRLTPEAAALSKKFADNQGKLPWPVERGTIVEHFGIQSHNIFSHLKIRNNGVDILTQPGAQVRAIFDGTVVGVITNASYKKSVLIRHGEYFTLYGNLASVSVQANDQVQIKQPIGVAYTNPGNNETLVHLEIWKGTTTLNPASWLTKP